MPPRSLEERVRVLCERAIAANTQEELNATFMNSKRLSEITYAMFAPLPSRQFPERSESAATRHDKKGQTPEVKRNLQSQLIRADGRPSITTSRMRIL